MVWRSKHMETFLKGQDSKFCIRALLVICFSDRSLQQALGQVQFLTPTLEWRVANDESGREGDHDQSSWIGMLDRSMSKAGSNWNKSTTTVTWFDSEQCYQDMRNVNKSPREFIRIMHGESPRWKIRHRPCRPISQRDDDSQGAFQIKIRWWVPYEVEESWPPFRN